MSASKRLLTGITTSGRPHLGNYVGAIRPAIAASRQPGTSSFYFLADYHALIKCHEPQRIQRSTLEIAATWLACGLDPANVYFYRQSDIPEIPELMWLLTCVTAKGLLNRAHAYKAATDANRSSDEEIDAGINAGLYLYPVLMAADILLFNADQVPVGRDQVQHIEMARDMAQRFNHLYGGDYFTLPEAVVENNVATLPGLDGRKMSKSYNNTIPLWLPQKELRKAILGIVTNSQASHEPKNPEESSIFSIYQAFASTEETAILRQAFAEGIGWGDAKQKLFERIDTELAPMREQYQTLIAKPGEIEEVLHAGANKARTLAQPLLVRLRNIVGLRSLGVEDESKRPETSSHKPSVIKGPIPKEGKYFFRVHDSVGNEALCSMLFEDVRKTGDLIQRMKNTGKEGFLVRPEEGGKSYLFKNDLKVAAITPTAEFVLKKHGMALEEYVLKVLDRCMPNSD